MRLQEHRSALAVHHTATDTGAWDGPGNKARLKNDGDSAYYRQAFAWVDPEADPETKAAYKMIHHEVGSDGRVGAANLRGCSAGIGVLNGGRGGTTIPDADRAGVHRHLAAHLEDADQEAPELKAFAAPDLETRSFPFDLAAVELRQEGDGPRSISWYPALFDALSDDLGGFRERIGRRAFTKTIADHDIRALINHDPNLILGRTSKGTVKLAVDLRGLHAEAALPQTSYVADLLANIASGNISGGSFGFRALKDNWRLEQIEGEEEPVLVRTVNEARLFDVSLVTFPAYPDTEGSASLRSLAMEWRAKLTEQPPEQLTGEATEQRMMDMCAAVKGMCATCEATDCAMNANMGNMEANAVDLSRYRRKLELQQLKQRRIQNA